MTAVQRLDLKALYGIPWQAGQYAIRAINYDWLSNTARVTLLGPPAQVPPATPHRAATRGDTSAPTRLPNFFQSKYSPPPPDSGITLRIPARPMPRGGQLPVFGSAKVAARADVVRASVILVRANVQNPIVLDLEIPVFPEDRTHPDGPAQLFFAYDLNAVASAPLPPATYQVYMVAGAYTAGPYPLTIE